MEDKRNLDEIQSEVQETVEVHEEIQDALSDNELNQVAGGVFGTIVNAVNEVTKSLGDALNTTSRRG
jgi:hypothetical protein